MKTIISIILLSHFCSNFVFAQTSLPPSQRELNGYLMHQFDNAVAGSFQGLAQEIKHKDGWIDHAYWLTKNHSAYMVLEFLDSCAGCLAIQLTGQDDPTILPFLGLRLGASKDSVISHIGKPSTVRHSDSLNLDLYTYKGRNYTIEIDSNNCLHSIRIVGYEGFPDSIEIDSSTTLESIRSVLQSNRADAILELISGDIEISIPQSKAFCSIKGSARKIIQDHQSSFSKLLYSSKPSVASLLTFRAIKKAEMNYRLSESRGLGIVYKLVTTAGKMEIVLFKDTGKYRIYEIKLGY